MLCDDLLPSSADAFFHHYEQKNNNHTNNYSVSQLQSALNMRASQHLSFAAIDRAMTNMETAKAAITKN